MSTNNANIDNFECYMDDVVERFEGFVKKSLILISIGVGMMLAMMMYLLKITTERQPLLNSSQGRAIPCRHSVSNTESKTSDNDMPSRINTLMDSYYRFKNNSKLKKNLSSTGIIACKKCSSSSPKTEECLLNNWKCSSSHSGGSYQAPCNPSVVSKPRMTISSLPTPIPQQTGKFDNKSKHRKLVGTMSPNGLTSKTSYCIRGPNETITPRATTSKTSYCIKGPTETITSRAVTSKTSCCSRGSIEAITPRAVTSKTSCCIRGLTETITPRAVTSKTSFCIRGQAK